MKTFITIIFFSLLIAGCGNDGPSLTLNGDACEESSQCESFAIDEENGGCWQELVSYDFFGGESVYTLDDGMCSIICEWSLKGTTEEQAQGTCYDEEYCLVYGASESICFQSCDVDNPCRDDYECVRLSHSKLSTCLPPADAARVINGDVKIMPAVIVGIME